MGSPPEPRSYQRADSVVFRKTRAKFGGLSNMAPGFPLSVNGEAVRTSEALYQAARFPHLPEIQRLIVAQKSPLTAKMKSKPYRSRSRPDWMSVRVAVMRWCLRVKLACNYDRFALLLLSTGDRPIVEESTKDLFWGAKSENNDDVLVGANVLGRLLMELREEVRASSADSLRHVQPPPIREFLFYGRPVIPIDFNPHSPSEKGGRNHALAEDQSCRRLAVATESVTQFEWKVEITASELAVLSSELLSGLQGPGGFPPLPITLYLQVSAPLPKLAVDEIRKRLREMGLPDIFEHERPY